MRRILAWMQLEGETPRERIRQNPIQLVVMVVTLWIATVITYFSFSMFMGEFWATLVIILGAIAVGFHLRDLLVPPRTDAE